MTADAKMLSISKILDSMGVEVDSGVAYMLLEFAHSRSSFDFRLWFYWNARICGSNIT